MTAAGALVLSSDEVRILGGLAGTGHADELVPDNRRLHPVAGRN